MNIIIYDAFSALRARLEHSREPAHLLIRGVINDACAPGRITIWVWDTAGGNEARRKIFPNYKNRPKQPSDKYAAILMLKELLTFTPSWQVSCPGFEGDDLVAAMVETFHGKAPIRIETRDGDLTALVRPGVTCTATAPVPPDQILLYKTTVGDASDTIPGIKGFGKEGWEKADKDKLRAFVDLILNSSSWADEQAAEAGLSKASINWLRQNEDQVIAMNTIIKPLPISPEQLEKSITRGVDNPAAIEASLKRYLQ